MADIQEYLNQIKVAVYGRDVRQAIHDAIRQCYDDGHSGSIDPEARAQAQLAIDNAANALLKANEVNAKTNGIFKLLASMATYSRAKNVRTSTVQVRNFNIPSGYKIVAIAGYNLTSTTRTTPNIKIQPTSGVDIVIQENGDVSAAASGLKVEITVLAMKTSLGS